MCYVAVINCVRVGTESIDYEIVSQQVTVQVRAYKEAPISVTTADSQNKH